MVLVGFLNRVLGLLGKASGARCRDGRRVR